MTDKILPLYVRKFMFLNAYKVMRYQYYIQGVHAVRIGFEDENPIDAARYDFERKKFVTDFKMISRVENDLDAKKVSRYECWDYIMSSSLQEMEDEDSDPSICSLPWHIYFDEKDDKKGVRVGRLIHTHKPRYSCRFYIGDEHKEFKGLTIHNVNTGVQLYDVRLPKEKSLASGFRAINISMKEGAEFLYNILYPPYFRQS